MNLHRHLDYAAAAALMVAATTLPALVGHLHLQTGASTRAGGFATASAPAPRDFRTEPHSAKFVRRQAMGRAAVAQPVIALGSEVDAAFAPGRREPQSSRSSLARWP